MNQVVSLRRGGRQLDMVEAKFELAEFLLRAADPAECAERTVAWLAKYAGVTRSLCAARQGAGPELVGIAGHGFARHEIRGFLLGDANDPLARVLAVGEPVTFGREANGEDSSRPDRDESLPFATPFQREPFTAFPLPLEAVTKERVGLLLTPRLSRSSMRDVMWAAGLLGQQLGRLCATKTLAHAQRHLSRERALMYGLINAVPDPVLLTDAEGRLVLANARAEALLASTENESEGRARAVALNNMLFSAALAQRAFGDLDANRRELPLVDPIDGSDRLFELLSAPVDTPDGPGVVAVLRNVTDLQRATIEIEENYKKLRRAEADVRAERDRLDLIIDSVADPIVVSNPSGGIVLMNAPAERLFTASPNAGREEAQRVRANDAHFSSHVANLFFSGNELRWRGDVGLVDPESGGAMPVEAISGKILSSHGEVTGVVTILHDQREALEKARLYEQLKEASSKLEEKVREATAELVHQNELLRRQHIQLEQASALKSQFLANMSHEFRTPLNAILGYTTILLQGVSGELPPPQLQKLSRIEANGRHLLAIINDILDISRIEAGKMPVHVTRFEPSALIEEILTELDPLIARSKVRVTSEHKKLSEVLSDRQKVKQIIANLVTNALKFTPTGSVHIRARHDRANDDLSIEVIDTGIGVDEKDQGVIFEDFRQADNSPTREYGGAGLGLAICRRLATVLGGKLTLKSELGKGSTFTLRMPRKHPGKRTKEGDHA